MTQPTNSNPENEQADWLDEIMEDLIIGHNFDYAAKAIRQKIVEALGSIENDSYTTGYEYDQQDGRNQLRRQVLRELNLEQSEEVEG